MSKVSSDPYSLFFPLGSDAFSILGTRGAFLGGMEGVLKILAVDNEPSITLSLLYVFTAPRYQLIAVRGGGEALALLDAGTSQFDVIIVDQKMPSLTGVELVSAIKQRGIASKIMVLSAQVSSEVRASYERMGVEVIFPKPFDIAQLRAAVDSLVD